MKICLCGSYFYCSQWFCMKFKIFGLECGTPYSFSARTDESRFALHHYADLSWHLCRLVKMCDIAFCGIYAYQRFNEHTESDSNFHNGTNLFPESDFHFIHCYGNCLSNLSVCPSVRHLASRRSIHLSIHPLVSLFICLSINLSETTSVFHFQSFYTNIHL